MINSTGTLLSNEDKQGFADIFTDAYSKEYKLITILVTTPTNVNGFYDQYLLFVDNDSTFSQDITKKPTYYRFQYIKNKTGLIMHPGDQKNIGIFVGTFTFFMAWNGDVCTISIGRNDGAKYTLPIENNVLTKTNTISFTPTANYHPATKKYVDDSIASAITTTLGGSF